MSCGGVEGPWAGSAGPRLAGGAGAGGPGKVAGRSERGRRCYWGPALCAQPLLLMQGYLRSGVGECWGLEVSWAGSAGPRPAGGAGAGQANSAPDGAWQSMWYFGTLDLALLSNQCLCNPNDNFFELFYAQGPSGGCASIEPWKACWVVEAGGLLLPDYQMLTDHLASKTLLGPHNTLLRCCTKFDCNVWGWET